jgi:hypothetical protein
VKVQAVDRFVEPSGKKKKAPQFKKLIEVIKSK